MIATPAPVPAPTGTGGYPPLTRDDLRRIKTHPRCTPAHLALLEILIETGEIVVVKGGEA